MNVEKVMSSTSTLLWIGIVMFLVAVITIVLIKRCCPEVCGKILSLLQEYMFYGFLISTMKIGLLSYCFSSVKTMRDAVAGNDAAPDIVVATILLVCSFSFYLLAMCFLWNEDVERLQSDEYKIAYGLLYDEVDYES